MPQYHNFTKFADNEGFMGFLKTMSVITKYYFGMFLIMIVFLIPLITMLRNGEEPNRAIHVSAFYTMLVAIVLFLGQIVTNSMYIFIPALIYVVTLGIRWYNKF